MVQTTETTIIAAQYKKAPIFVTDLFIGLLFYPFSSGSCGSVGFSVAVGLGVGVDVLVAVGVGVGVSVTSGVISGAGVCVGVDVGLSEPEMLGSGVSDTAGVGVIDADGVAEIAGVTELSGEDGDVLVVSGVGVGVSVGIGVGVSEGLKSVEPPALAGYNLPLK